MPKTISKLEWKTSFPDHGRDIYLHNIVCWTFEPKNDPRLGKEKRYLVVESQLPAEAYLKDGCIVMDNVVWQILKQFHTIAEAKAYVEWICEPNHDGTYELLY